MGLFEKTMSKKSIPVLEASVEARQTPGKYTAEEYEFLFMLIKNSTFKGDNLEFLYNLTLKLQEDYISIKKQSEI